MKNVDRLKTRCDKVSTSAAIIGFAAFSGSGKTTLVRGIIPLLQREGNRIGVIKHAHHNFTVDTPGKDSYELRDAGAEQVLIASRQRLAWVKETRQEEEPKLADLLPYYAGQGLDLIIVEGFKREPFPKIEVHRSSLHRPLLASSDPHIIAVATDTPDSLSVDDADILNLDNHHEIADFILRRMKQRQLPLIP